MEPTKHPMYPWLSGIRRDFHRHPETGLKEYRTTARIREILGELGVEIQELPGVETGTAALITGQARDRTLAFRADIDALPIQELNDVPYRSAHDGVMHACGHDAHTTILLGVIKHLVESGLNRQIKGRLKFIFQPAEEIAGGAKRMIQAGVLQNPPVDRMITAHVIPDLPVGQVGLIQGPSHAAADSFRMTIQGKGGHGARPNQANDPIVAGTQFYQAVQTIVSRNVNPLDPAVITVGKFHAGSAGNIIPEKAVLEGTVRTFSAEARETIMKRLEEIVAGVEKTFQVKTDFHFREGVPVCHNDETVVAFLSEAAGKVLGKENVVHLPQTMGAEDVAFFHREVPGAVIRLGCSNDSKDLTGRLHSPHFDLDEGVLPVGLEVFLEAIRSYLG